ncbi:MAG: hypothetical protein SXG53_18620 [Pseudomonadota bacterium]|nr:hypothetical protein [Pseudomonadota bacterium]
MNASFEDRKLAEALASVRDIIAKLKEGEAKSWLGYFERLEVCLVARDVEGAVRVRDALPIAGMGAFGDFLETMPQLQSAFRTVSETIGALKVFTRYGIVRERRS